MEPPNNIMNQHHHAAVAALQHHHHHPHLPQQQQQQHLHHHHHHLAGGGGHHHHHGVGDLFLGSPAALTGLPALPPVVQETVEEVAAAAAVAAGNDNPDEEDDNDNDNDGNKDAGTSGKHRTWEDNFAALVKFKTEHEHCFVPVNYSEDPTLGRWCAKLRKMRSTLKPERRARLEYLGFSFTNPKQALEDKNWNDNFERLREHYAAAFGNNPNANGLETQLKAKMDPVLNRWVSRQRRNKKDGILSEERQQKLESIGFRWVLVEQKRKDYSKKDLHWIQQYNSLAAFQKQFGHCNVPHGKQTPYWSLAKWVARQRELYKEKRLLDDRKELLEALGFIWSMETKSWNDNFSRLAAHVRDYQHLDFHGDSSLGRWFYSQRVRYANGTLTEERTRLFKSLGIKFDGTKASLRSGDTDDEEGGGGRITNKKPKANGSNPLLFTVDFPMKPPKGTKIRKKRFMDGWCVGEIIDTDHKDVSDNRIKAKVLFDDGDEEYLSDEECRVAAIAYAIHATPPKLKLDSAGTNRNKSQAAKRKRGRPAKIPNSAPEAAANPPPAAKNRPPVTPAPPAAAAAIPNKKPKPAPVVAGTAATLPVHAAALATVGAAANHAVTAPVPPPILDGADDESDNMKPQATPPQQLPATAAAANMQQPQQEQQQHSHSPEAQQPQQRGMDPPVLYV